MKGIHEVLAELRESAFDERHKGDLFEALTKKYLEIDPFYRTYFDKVWLYGDWAEETGLSKQDTGIDLVARVSETGEIAAMQCKFFAEGAYLDKKEIDSFFTASGKEPFRERYIFSTTDNWSRHASEAVEGQQIPTLIIRVQDLDDSGIDWSDFSLENPTKLGLLKKKTPFAHQLEAIEAAKSHFQNHDRGKMIMACGTGKTYTSLRIAHELTPKGGTVLFLVPSLALLSQTLKEWKREATTDFRAYAVCSDSKLSRQSSSEDTRVADLAYPSTTNVEKLAAHFNQGTDAELTVIFSTYQSIDVVAQAQGKGLPVFDLIVCDEAHRTTGVTLVDEDESAFVRVHDNNFIKGSKRLYMTATPRIFAEASKAKAEEASAVIASMDDETKFGEEFHRLNFGNAVSRGLLSDYKVLVLTVSETQVSKSLQNILSEGDELRLQDAIKIVGCYNGLRKRGANEEDFIVDKTPMRTAVAFSRSIKDSKRIAELFSTVTAALNEEAKEKNALVAEADHVDGTFNVLARNEKLDWLKDKRTENTVRVLSNARCLSEGVDVPALDAVLFLNPRDSQVDVVQSVGRVMRKAEGKQYGYVILPIAVPAGKSAEQALADNKNYKVVWQVLQALRAHDERFDALVNKIDLTGQTGGVIEIIDASPANGGDWDGDSKPKEMSKDTAPSFDFDFADWKDAILARIVQKVGQKTYWENWAKDVAGIAQNHISRINNLLDNSDDALRREFAVFHKGLKDNINPHLSESEAIEMLAQHLITKPVFDSLFENYSFTDENPVSIVMQKMLQALERVTFNDESDKLEDFYESVRARASGITDASGKQKVIKELYEKFFKIAFAKDSDRLGIVYTPNEIVDFMLRITDSALGQYFNKSLSDENVSVLDPFTGTGTFIVRLMQGAIIRDADLVRKFRYELHANEIVLLAYYVAAINIEESFHARSGGEYRQFKGIVLTDTFQMYENEDVDEIPGLEVFEENNARVISQKNQKITVVIGNPPYSAGQSSSNDNNANVKYPTLDSRVADTFGSLSKTRAKNTLYDSYIRAIRWSIDRVAGGGIVSFVTNNGYLDSNTAEGVRKSLVRESSQLFIVNLRGNSRSLEIAKQEGGNVFDVRVGIAIMFVIKAPNAKNAGDIKYFEFDDFATKADKLAQLEEWQSIDEVPWVDISPNEKGDWLNQRTEQWRELVPLLDATKKGGEPRAIFRMSSSGAITHRDAWVFNFSKRKLENNVLSMLDFYNNEVSRLKNVSGKRAHASTDPTKINWSHNLWKSLEQSKLGNFIPESIRVATYRPFVKTNYYSDKFLSHSLYQLNVIFPSGFENSAILTTGAGVKGSFKAMAISEMPESQTLFNDVLYPRWFFPKPTSDHESLFGSNVGKVSAISAYARELFSSHYEQSISDDEIYFYVFGVLSHEGFIQVQGANLTKDVPAVPLLANFNEISQIGRELFEAQTSVESRKPFPADLKWSKQPSSDEDFIPLKPSISVVGDSIEIKYNAALRICGIPQSAISIKFGTRSALEWVVDRLNLAVDKNSGITNSANNFFESSEECLNYLLKIVSAGVEFAELSESLSGIALD